MYSRLFISQKSFPNNNMLLLWSYKEKKSKNMFKKIQNFQKQSTLNVHLEPQTRAFYINTIKTQYHFNELFIIQFVFSFVSKNLANELNTLVLNKLFTKIFKLKVKYFTCETPLWQLYWIDFSPKGLFLISIVD